MGGGFDGLDSDAWSGFSEPSCHNDVAIFESAFDDDIAADRADDFDRTRFEASLDDDIDDIAIIEDIFGESDDVLIGAIVELHLDESAWAQS